MHLYLYDDCVSDKTAEAHFVEWCLKLENHDKPVPHCSLDAVAFFQKATYGYDKSKRGTLKLAGIDIR